VSSQEDYILACYPYHQLVHRYSSPILLSCLQLKYLEFGFKDI
jgi:hypothetical protein